jgi:beta-galactosidase/beta-glucuronidase
LHLENPRLWWPKGYGAPNLYEVDLTFEVKKGEASDTKHFLSGVRQMDFNEDGGILTLFVNGRRFIGRGGNWGFSESNLNYRSREYDIAVAHHANMNFTIIRNWVGQTGDESFFEACDKHGIMVWQDFWLANPWDGPVPDDNDLFMANAEDFVKRIRNHPSIAIYVGRNEGNPPQALDDAIRAMLPILHPGIHYISHSAAGVVSGEGPYRALPPRDYYLLYGNDRFHSERGMPNVMTYESLAQTVPADKLWPQNNFYGLHDYTLASAQSAATFNEMIEKAFGQPANARQFTEWAQWINYNGYRGMFEGRSEYRRGLLLWMSHSAWPSMVWQTYDYYFDPTAAYFGCKKANEPLHVQWNPIWDGVEVVNYHARNHHSLKAKAQLLNMDGTVQWEKDTLVDSNEDSTVKCFPLELPGNLSSVFFIRLTLTEGDVLVSDNFYWRGKEDGNYQALNQLPKTSLTAKTSVSEAGGEWLLTTTLKNETTTPALMVRLQVNGSKTAERILPVFFSDNFFSLMPGEEKIVTMRLQDVDTRGERPTVTLSGFNI